MIINTHYHRRPHARESGLPGGHARRRDAAHARPAEPSTPPYWSGAAADTLPNETFDATHELALGGKTVRASTSGAATRAAISWCSSSRTACCTPAICSSTAATRTSISKRAARVKEWIGTLDRVMALDFDRVIPGHGAGHRSRGHPRVPAFLRELWSRRGGRARGQSLEETLRCRAAHAGRRLRGDRRPARAPARSRLRRDSAPGRKRRAPSMPQGPAAGDEEGSSNERRGSVLGRGQGGAGHRRLARHRADDRARLRRGGRARSTSRRARRTTCDAAAAELSKLGTCIALPGRSRDRGRHARARRRARRARAARCTSWSTTPAPTGARRSPSIPTPAGTRCWRST